MVSHHNSKPANQAEELVARFCVRSPPVPVEKIAKLLGAQVRFSPLDEELSGMIYISENTPIIGVNSLQHPNRQRFTIAHEIAHFQLHRHRLSGKVHVDKQFRVQFAKLNRDTNSSTGTETIEIQANQFAAALLMPRAIFLPALRSKRFDIDDEGPLNELAKSFQVSRQALEHRIAYLLHQGDI